MRTVRTVLIDLFGEDAPSRVADPDNLMDTETNTPPRLLTTEGTGDAQIRIGGQALINLGRPGKAFRHSVYLVLRDDQEEKWLAASRRGEKPEGSCPNRRLTLVLS